MYYSYTKIPPHFNCGVGFFSVAETNKSRLNNLSIDITTAQK